MKEKARKIFVYLLILAVILGVFGILMLTGTFTGQTITGKGIYEQKEIAKHNSEKDCWISIDDKIYDITLFLQIYPENLRDKCGKDVKAKDLSEDVLETLEQYKIGKVK